MEVDKDKLQMMMREYWSIDNNEVCLAMTIIFLRDLGLSDKEIRKWIDYHSLSDGFPEITEDDKMTWADSMEEQVNYWSVDDE